ncbi:DUF4440 domain-containing protein [Aeoliella sp. SH292]|uniref:DUF4440 domain-containing protein n=1 Tax=Aeoliella sp. SH292 TaxID=3454464 RepID=UPI003F9C5396
MKTLPSLSIALVLVAIAHSTAAVAQETGDVAAIRAAGKAYVDASKRGDAAKLQTLWTPDGDYIDAAGTKFKVKGLLALASAQGKPNPEVIEIPQWESTIRLITPSVAIEDGEYPDVDSPDGRSLSSRFTAVWVNRDGQWLLDSLREATSETDGIEPELHQLDWLVGEWAGKSGPIEIVASNEFSEDGHYLLRSFLISAPGREPITANERIKWDPALKKFHSWVFDSNGGTGEGIWTKDGDTWRVDLTATLPTGEELTTQSSYSPTKNGGILWKSTPTRAGGEALPTQQLEFKRASE